MAQIDIEGGVPATTLSGGITSGATSISVTDGSGYPTGAGGNFFIVIDLGLSSEEVVECSARSGNTLTAATRGADGTSATAHDSGAAIAHVVPASALQEANTHANQTTGTPHGSAYLTAADNAATATALETARSIGGVSFDGTTSINLPGVNQAGNQDTSGNAATASALETARDISLGGDATGSASFDGSGNVTITAALAANSVDTAELADDAVTAAKVDGGVTQMETVVFTTSGTFSKASYSWARYARVRVVGAGGAGGGAATTSASQGSVGAGGGGGGYAEELILLSAMGASETVTVGSGGSGSSGNNGGNGGDSSFGSFLTGGGGEGGVVRTTTDATFPGRDSGDGGTATGGDINIPGGDGVGGFWISANPGLARGGYGGASHIGAAQRPGNSDKSAGQAGVSYGGGGSGASNDASAGSALAGGDGADGVVIVELFGGA